MATALSRNSCSLRVQDRPGSRLRCTIALLSALQASTHVMPCCRRTPGRGGSEMSTARGPAEQFPQDLWEWETPRRELYKPQAQEPGTFCLAHPPLPSFQPQDRYPLVASNDQPVALGACLCHASDQQSGLHPGARPCVASAGPLDASESSVSVWACGTCAGPDMRVTAGSGRRVSAGAGLLTRFCMPRVCGVENAQSSCLLVPQRTYTACLAHFGIGSDC